MKRNAKYLIGGLVVLGGIVGGIVAAVRKPRIPPPTVIKTGTNTGFVWDYTVIRDGVVIDGAKGVPASMTIDRDAYYVSKYVSDPRVTIYRTDEMGNVVHELDAGKP